MPELKMPAEKRDSTKFDMKTKICSEKKVKKAINALKLLEEKFVEKDLKKQPLLENETESLVFLQIILKKIPPPQLLKMIGVSLPHSLITETSEVCLITGDLEKRNHKAEVEPTVLHYKDLLKKHGVTNVAQVIPLRQLRTEYKTFESKRQLAAAYDVFLVDKKIAGVVPKTLGKSFFQGRKFPIQIDMRRLNLKDQIDKALCQTKFSMSCRGNSYALEIARLSMENDAILENIMASIEVLANKLPGKENNILTLYLKTAKSKAMPIYVSLDITDDISIKKPRKTERVGLDELSTIDNAKVKVFRDGRVILIKTKKNSSNYEDAAEDDTNTNVLMENEGDTQESAANEVSLKKKKKSKKTSDSIEITDKDELENKEYTQDSVDDKTSPKKKKKGKKSICLDQVADSSLVENEDIQDSVTTELSSKKKKKEKKCIVDISDIEVDSQNVPACETSSKKKNKKNMNTSHVEADEPLEDVKESSMLLNSKKQKIHESDNVNEKAKKFKNKGKKVSENEENGEIGKNTRSKIHRNILEVAEENVKTPKSKKEKKAKNAAEKESSLTFIEDEEIIQNDKTPSRSRKMKKESTEGFITPITSSMSKRKRANDIKNNLESDKRQKRHTYKT